MIGLSLFPELPDLVQVAPPEKLSADRRRTQRQKDDVERGVHPLVGGPLNADPEAKCGNCIHRLPSQGRSSWPKCDLTSMSSSASSDCRAWWPGCLRHEPALPVDIPVHVAVNAVDGAA